MAIEYSALNLSASRGFLFAINEPLTLYVATDGDNEINTGFSIDSPWATPHRALTYLKDKFIADGAIVTIKCAAGNYLFDENIVVSHPCGDRIAIVGANPLELTLKQVDDYIDTTGKTGGDPITGGGDYTGTEEEGGQVYYPLGCNRTGIQIATGKTGEDITYTSGVADANAEAYGERFAMVCTVSGATAALTTDDTYVLIRGFSGGYESSNSTLTEGTTADYTPSSVEGNWGEGNSGYRYPSLNMANRGRDASSAKRPPGDNFAFFKESTDIPTSALHNNRYPYWREPENYLQRFFALGCHKITGIGTNTPGLHTGTEAQGGISGSHLARITVENKNTNRNPWGKDEYGFTNNTPTDWNPTGQSSWAAQNNCFDYDNPTPKTKPGTDLDDNDSVGYDPHATQGARPSVGDEDESFGSDPQTHGVFTVTGVRTIFTFSKNCTFKYAKNESNTSASKSAILIDSQGLYRLDNLIIRPEADIATANANEWGVPRHDNDGSTDQQHRRERYRGIQLLCNSNVHHLGPNIGITDFTETGLITDGGTCVASSIVVQNCKRGMYTSSQGDVHLYNATILSNPGENIRVEQAAKLSIHRSFVMGSGRHVWGRNGSSVVATDTAFLYGMQYQPTEIPAGGKNGTFRFDRNTTGEVSRCLMHRSGSGYCLYDNSSLNIRYAQSQESWHRSFTSTDNSHLTLNWVASIKARECGVLSWSSASVRLGNMLISGTGFTNVMAYSGDNRPTKGIWLSGGASVYMDDHVVLYNGFDGHAIEMSFGPCYIENAYPTERHFWIHNNLGQYGEGSGFVGDGGAYGTGNPYTLYNGGGGYNDSRAQCCSMIGDIKVGLSPGDGFEGEWNRDNTASSPSLISFSERAGITYT
jgi:hypothetical protein